MSGQKIIRGAREALRYAELEAENARLREGRETVAALLASLHTSRERGDKVVSLDWLIVRLEESQQHPASGADGGASAEGAP
jgi:hypothetical protein